MLWKVPVQNFRQLLNSSPLALDQREASGSASPLDADRMENIAVDSTHAGDNMTPLNPERLLAFKNAVHATLFSCFEGLDMRSILNDLACAKFVAHNL